MTSPSASRRPSACRTIPGSQWSVPCGWRTATAVANVTAGWTSAAQATKPRARMKGTVCCPINHAEGSRRCAVTEIVLHKANSQLTKPGVSNNVGGVKHLFRAHYSMHFEKSAISLSSKKCRVQPRLARNQYSGLELSPQPFVLFGHNLDHDYYSELLCEEQLTAKSISRFSAAHHRLFPAAGPRANRTFSLGSMRLRICVSS